MRDRQSGYPEPYTNSKVTGDSIHDSGHVDSIYHEEHNVTHVVQSHKCLCKATNPALESVYVLQGTLNQHINIRTYKRLHKPQSTD